MTTHHCLTCGHPATHHVTPTDDLFAAPSTEIHGCHIITEPDTITELVDWQLHESPAARGEQRRRENAARGSWRDA